jgi:hypothetical protein
MLWDAACLGCIAALRPLTTEVERASSQYTPWCSSHRTPHMASHSQQSQACGQACGGRACTCLEYFERPTSRPNHSLVVPYECSRCCGCTHLASSLQVKKLRWDPDGSGGEKARLLPRQTGATGMYVFAVTPISHGSGAQGMQRHVIRFAQGLLNKTCSSKFAPSMVAKARLLQRILHACSSIEQVFTVPKVAPLRTEVPDVEGGLMHVEEAAIFLPEAPGADLQTLSKHARGERVPRIASEALITAAVMDTLINAGDVRMENMFVTSDGQLTLIDTLARAFDYSTRPNNNSGPDSIMVPGSYVFLRGRTTSLKAALDYRCHVPGRSGQLGRDYSQPIRECLATIANGSAFHVGASEVAAASVEIVDCATDGHECREAPHPSWSDSSSKPGLACSPRCTRAARTFPAQQTSHPSSRPAVTQLSPLTKVHQCDSSHALCVPVELPKRAKQLLDLGFEATLASLNPRFSTRGPPSCAYPDSF